MSKIMQPIVQDLPAKPGFVSFKAHREEVGGQRESEAERTVQITQNTEGGRDWHVLVG